LQTTVAEDNLRTQPGPDSECGEPYVSHWWSPFPADIAKDWRLEALGERKPPPTQTI